MSTVCFFVLRLFLATKEGRSETHLMRDSDNALGRDNSLYMFLFQIVNVILDSRQVILATFSKLTKQSECLFELFASPSSVMCLGQTRRERNVTTTSEYPRPPGTPPSAVSIQSSLPA